MINQVAQSDTFETQRQIINQSIDRWNVLGSSASITIAGGSIDDTAIGQTTPSQGTFTIVTVSNTLDVRGTTILTDPGIFDATIISGGTLTVDSVVLTGPPTADLEAATKKYVDDSVASVDDQTIAFAIALG